MDPIAAAEQLKAEVDALSERSAIPLRQLRRKLSRRIRRAEPEVVRRLVGELMGRNEIRWMAYELIANHPETFRLLDRKWLRRLGAGMDSWGAVDQFARILSGPAWRDGLIDRKTICDWASSHDSWWRRAALVSTVALNVRSQGGQGDPGKTLAICQMLAYDHDDMVAKALSWALRALVVHDPGAVRAFLRENEEVLAARVKREVANKLKTGLKNPKK